MQAYVFAVTQHNLYDHHEGDSAETDWREFSKLKNMSRKLGKTVAEDEDVFAELLPQIIRGSIQIRWFGGGLARGAVHPGSLWLRLVAQFTASSEEHRSAEVLAGFLGELYLKNSHLANTLLDNTLKDETLAPFYPQMQTAMPIDDLGSARLPELAQGEQYSGVPEYRRLSYGRAADSISGEDFKTLVLGIAAKKDGFEAATDIVHMRLHTGPGETKPHPRCG